MSDLTLFIWEEHVRSRSTLQAAILFEMARADRPMASGDVAQAVFRDQASVSSALNAMRDEGLLRRTARGRRRLYEIVDPRYLVTKRGLSDPYELDASPRPPRKCRMKKRKNKPRHPTQPIVLDRKGVPRFLENPIVSWLVDQLPNRMSTVGEQRFAPEDREQLAMLIGYSLSGAADLRYFSDQRLSEAQALANALSQSERPAPSSRAERIAEARARLEELEPEYLRVHDQYADAQSKLRRAEDSFDVGERVRVNLKCPVEGVFEGRVESGRADGALRYDVRLDDGSLVKDLWALEMTRI